MNAKSRSTRPSRANRPRWDAYDEADWVDWDHWQTVEEMQNFLNGVQDRPETAEHTDLEDGDGLVARQIRRYGLQADG
jgi:hypothetical protein